MAANVQAAAGRYSLESFLQATAQQDKGQGLFELENAYTLEMNLNQTTCWMKLGTMVAYRGDVSFTREGMMEHGFGKALKKMFTGEGAYLSKAEGLGQVYLADSGKRVFIMQLNNEAMIVNGNDILAFEGEDKIDWDIKLMKSAGAAMAGGLTNVRLSGTGLIAITTHYQPLTLKVEPGKPVFTDPNATVAWSDNLRPELKLDASMRTLMGRGSGESLQMAFRGEGFVIVQPYEETYPTYNA